MNHTFLLCENFSYLINTDNVPDIVLHRRQAQQTSSKAQPSSSDKEAGPTNPGSPSRTRCWQVWPKGARKHREGCGFSDGASREERTVQNSCEEEQTRPQETPWLDPFPEWAVSWVALGWGQVAHWRLAGRENPSEKWHWRGLRGENLGFQHLPTLGVFYLGSDSPLKGSS